MTTTAPRTVLLTGAAGVVGQAFLRDADDLRVVAAAHSSSVPRPPGGPAFDVLRCDVSAPRLGLDDDSYRALARDIDVVVHSAGLTEWGLPAERYTPVNVDGTRHVLELAELAGAPVHLMSTAFVAALDEQAPYPLSDDNVVANYVRSKRAAEDLLRASGLPHTIFRPTNLIGDSATGWTSQGQIVQLISDWICRGRAPLLPAHPGNRTDIVPQDLLTRAVVAAIRADDRAGEFWVTYGEAAMDMETSLEVCAKYVAACGRSLTLPPIVDPASVGPAELQHLAPMARGFVSVLRDVSEITRCSGGVLPTSLPELTRRYGLPEVLDTDTYLRTLEYAGEHFG